MGVGEGEELEGHRDGPLCVFPQEPPFVGEQCRQGIPPHPELAVWMAFPNFMFSGKEIKNGHAWRLDKMKHRKVL